MFCSILFCSIQELESLEQEVATIEGKIQEMILQLKPLESAKAAAQQAHKVRSPSEAYLPPLSRSVASAASFHGWLAR